MNFDLKLFHHKQIIMIDLIKIIYQFEGDQGKNNHQNHSL